MINISIEIPHKFDDNEKICRTIFSPHSLKKDNKSLRANAFTPPSLSEDISVNRLSYTDCHFVKKISKIIQQPDYNRNYCGFAILNANDIFQSDSVLFYSPMEFKKDDLTIENIFHSDIKIGFKKVPNEPLPPQYNFKVETLIKKARYYHDSNPENEKWESGDLI